ncbi:hypothetical protein B0H16DRAFT_1878336 [Mycena metata]|uniref:Uncharacterized protein n=1 Tax=Mycena metata TaxID=1033252 RepID=A0AAD7NXY3_9AGAR|nr:hypothetical protein B0H16DRAFT_1878336 [Mycena metata]
MLQYSGIDVFKLVLEMIAYGRRTTADGDILNGHFNGASLWVRPYRQERRRRQPAAGGELTVRNVATLLEGSSSLTPSEFAITPCTFIAMIPSRSVSPSNTSFSSRSELNRPVIRLPPSEYGL